MQNILRLPRRLDSPNHIHLIELHLTGSHLQYTLTIEFTAKISEITINNSDS